MAAHSSNLAWKIPWMEEPGRLKSMGSLRVAYDWVTSLSTFMHWRRKWQPTPVFLPGESQGRGSLLGCRLWGCTELDTTDATQQQQRPLPKASQVHLYYRPLHSASHRREGMRPEWHRLFAQMFPSNCLDAISLLLIMLTQSLKIISMSTLKISFLTSH